MIPKLESLQETLAFTELVHRLPAQERTDILRYLARTDLFFLLWAIIGRKDMWHPWLYARCKEVEASPDGHLDLWARDHYKSTIITYGKSIQDILASHGDDPLPEWKGRECTIGIFSHTRPIAKAFLKQIKRTFEENAMLKSLFPDILWRSHKQAPKWTEDEGIIVMRRSNPKEATVEAWGVVEGQPTGMHFLIRVYDDLVTRESVTTPDQIKKTTEAVQLSFNLGDSRHGRARFIGTRYNFNDTYKHLMDQNVCVPRIYPATQDGTANGKPVFLSPEQLAEKKKQGPFVFACQHLQNPKEDGKMGFQKAWLKFYKNTPIATNNYILVDPANARKRESDFTAIWVIGLGPDNNYYVLDGIRDRIRMSERANIIFDLHRIWKPLAVGYERYGKDTDIEFLEEKMEHEHYRFHVTELGGANKYDRINNWLIPIYEQGRMWLPHHMFKTSSTGERYDLVKVFVDEEYDPYPVGIHPDMLDAMSRVLDPELAVTWPKPIIKNDPRKRRRRKVSWSTA